MKSRNEKRVLVLFNAKIQTNSIFLCFNSHPMISIGYLLERIDGSFHSVLHILRFHWIGIYIYVFYFIFTNFYCFTKYINKIFN